MTTQYPVHLTDTTPKDVHELREHPAVKAVYAGNSLRWCPSESSTAETATDLVPAAFGANYAVDRALLLGGQALAEAYGKARQTGNPYFWSEKELDHGDKLEILIGMIAGDSKIRFEIEHGDGKQFTDFGVMAIDTAVQLA